MTKFSIAVTEGDGIGPEITAEVIKVLKKVGETDRIEVEFVDAPSGGAAYKKYGNALPDDTLKIYRDCDAIFKAPVGVPDLPPGLIEHEAILRARQELDLYVNLRPAKIYPGMENLSPLKDRVIAKGFDVTIVRENSEGLYSRRGTKTADRATDESVFTKRGVDRIIRFAFDYARKAGKTKVTSVDKANILFTSQYWRSRFEEIKKEYPGFETESIYVDAMSQYLIRCPERYQVVVTDNMFGDILSDETAQIIGSLGLCAGANLNPETKTGMFEPIHGSAPDIAGKGIANPISAILSAAMMLDFLGQAKSASKVEAAVQKALADGCRTGDIAQGMPWLPTSKFGDEVAKRI